MPFPLRAALIRQVDNAAQRPARIVGREYLAVAHLPGDGATRLWRTARGHWAQLAATYNACLTEFTQSDERPEAHRVELTRLTVRHIRAYATRLKWDQFRYWPPSDALWLAVGRAYLYALDNGFARREVSAYPGERRQPPGTGVPAGAGRHLGTGDAGRSARPGSRVTCVFASYSP